MFQSPIHLLDEMTGVVEYPQQPLHTPQQLSTALLQHIQLHNDNDDDDNIMSDTVSNRSEDIISSRSAGDIIITVQQNL